MVLRQENPAVTLPEKNLAAFLAANHKDFVHSKMKSSSIPRTEGFSSSSKNSGSSRSKSGQTFDFSALSNSLPPNTGPPGTATVTSGAGSSSNTNKNLSHVPCKFFKQGICQAGKSCPFSHNLDGTLAADKLPCKYFQKGNCKFGLKCALAHFLPDGTQVNSKSNQSYRRGNSDKYERSGNGRSNGSYSNQNYTTSNANSSSNSSTNVGNYANNAESYLTDMSTEDSQPFTSKRMSDPIDIGSNMISLPSLGSGNQQSNEARLSREFVVPASRNGSSFSNSRGFNGADWQIDTSSLADSSNLFSSNAFTSSIPTSSPVSLFMSGKSPIAENHSANTTIPSPTQNSISGSRFKNDFSTSSSPLYNYSRTGIDDSAIIESDEVGPEEDEFYEDYIPASIGNLIFTPQEKQRRESRSQSGTLLSRQNSFSTVDKKADPFAKANFKGNDGVFLMD